jgi:hypothetical protein
MNAIEAKGPLCLPASLPRRDTHSLHFQLEFQWAPLLVLTLWRGEKFIIRPGNRTQIPNFSVEALVAQSFYRLSLPGSWIKLELLWTECGVLCQALNAFRKVGRDSVAYGMDDSGIESLQGQQILRFSKWHRPALGSIQPSIQWVLGGPSQE